MTSRSSTSARSPRTSSCRWIRAARSGPPRRSPGSEEDLGAEERGRARQVSVGEMAQARPSVANLPPPVACRVPPIAPHAAAAARLACPLLAGTCCRHAKQTMAVHSSRGRGLRRYTSPATLARRTMHRFIGL
jgi:hypothetical protein